MDLLKDNSYFNHMKNDKTKLTLWFLVISIVVFLGIQLLLLFNSYELEKNKFIYLKQSLVHSAFFQLDLGQSELERLSLSLLADKANMPPAEIIKNLKSIMSDYENFEEVLKKSFHDNNIDVGFDYSVAYKKYFVIDDSNHKRIIFDNFNYENGPISIGTLKYKKNDYLSSSFYLKGFHYFVEIYLYVRYKNETVYVFKQMQGLFFISLLTTLIVFSIFFYTVKTIIKQKKLNEMKSDFINNITHEFNTPLNTIKVAGTNLKNEQTKKYPEKVEQLADIIIRQNSRLQKLIEDVMNASVLEEEKLLLNYSDVDLYELVTIAASDIKIKYEEHEIDFTIESPREVICRCDEFQIMTAVYNLIDNAAKYSPEKSNIEIIIRREDQTIELDITDHGIGISGEDQKHIFEKFFRTRNGKFASVKGLGLGLYFVKKIIDAHSGSIDVVSSPGKGSRFVIHLPAAK